MGQLTSRFAEFGSLRGAAVSPRVAHFRTNATAGFGKEGQGRDGYWSWLKVGGTNRKASQDGSSISFIKLSRAGVHEF